MLTEAQAIALLPEVLRALRDRLFVRIDLHRTDGAGTPLTCQAVIRDTVPSSTAGLTRIVGFDGEHR
jgi:hypothetical protein